MDLDRLVRNWAKHKRRSILVGAVGFVLSVAMLVPYAELQDHHASPWLIHISFAAYILSLLISVAAFATALPTDLGINGLLLVFRVLVSAVLWLVIVILSVLLRIPFGRQAAVANIFLDVTTEATPIGSWEFRLVEPPTSAVLKKPVPPWMHMVYENPSVHKILGEWIEKRRAFVEGTDAI